MLDLLDIVGKTYVSRQLFRYIWNASLLGIYTFFNTLTLFIHKKTIIAPYLHIHILSFKEQNLIINAGLKYPRFIRDKKAWVCCLLTDKPLTRHHKKY